MKIGIVTCAAEKIDHFYPTVTEPEFIPTESPITPDDQLIVNELRKRGHIVLPVVWDTNISELKDFDLLIMRSPWDYMDSKEKRERFEAWLSELAFNKIRVTNPVSFMQWMLDKHYLQDLATKQVAMIPTVYIEQGTSLDLSKTFAAKGQFVVKPCISADGVGLFHIKSKEDATRYQSAFAAGLNEGSYMLQDFVHEIRQNGEWSFVFLGGNYSHCVHKKPGVHSILVQSDNGGSLTFDDVPSEKLIQFAKQAYGQVLPAFHAATGSASEQDLLYLRVDVIERESGCVVVECEGVEPELFFRANANAVLTFCDALEQRYQPKIAVISQPLMRDVFPKATTNANATAEPLALKRFENQS